MRVVSFTLPDFHSPALRRNLHRERDYPPSRIDSCALLYGCMSELWTRKQSLWGEWSAAYCLLVIVYSSSRRRTAVFTATTYADNRKVIIIIAINTKKYIQETVKVCDGDCLGVLPHRKPLVLKISPIASIGNIFKSNTSGAKIDA
jgi:hypothetical protein